MNNNVTQQVFAPNLSALHPVVSLGKGVFFGIFSVGFLQFMYIFGSLVAIVLITISLYALVRLYEIQQDEAKKKKAKAAPAVAPIPAVAATAGTAAPTAPIVNPTWQHIREELLSDNNNDWKLAIIEADIYMDRLLDDKGFHGDTTGDKLKQVTADRLPSISIAWEMHKVRNRIAHEGAAFVLTMPEARRMLSFYEMIFQDLGVI